MESPGKPPARDSSIFIPPPALQKLRSQNEQLRQELRDLSTRLDELLSTYPKKTANTTVVRSKEVANARTQLEHHEKQLRELQRQQQLLSPTKLEDLQGVVDTIKQQIKTKETSNKSLRRLEKDRGTMLSALTEETGNYADLKGATDELRRTSRAVAEVEKEIQRGDEVHKTVCEKVTALEAVYKQIVSENGVQEDDEPKPLPVGDQDLSTIKAKCEQLEKKKAADQSSFRREVQSAEAQLALVQKQIAEAQAIVKEKERKSRILALAVKEASYNLKLTTKKNESMAAAIKSEANAQETSSAFVTNPIGEEKVDSARDAA